MIIFCLSFCHSNYHTRLPPLVTFIQCLMMFRNWPLHKSFQQHHKDPTQQKHNYNIKLRCRVWEMCKSQGYLKRGTVTKNISVTVDCKTQFFFEILEIKCTLYTFWISKTNPPKKFLLLLINHWFLYSWCTVGDCACMVSLFRLGIVASIKLSERTEIWYNLADVDQG